MKFEAVTQDTEKNDSDSDKLEESEIIFKKMTPKRHSRTESISVSKLNDLQLDSDSKPKQEFQVIVTEAEDIVKSFDQDEPSDKISSESSREVEISERKSSEGVSDKISSEDAVTEKKTSSSEDGIKETSLERDQEKEIISVVQQKDKEVEKVDSKIQSIKQDYVEKGIVVV